MGTGLMAGSLTGKPDVGVATTTSAGLMSAPDKVILNALAAPQSRVLATSNASVTFLDTVAKTMIFNVENFDTLGEYNNATGVFTATVAGSYLVSFALRFQNAAATPTYLNTSLIGGAYSVLAPQGYDSSVAATPVMSTTASAVFNLAIGETIYVSATVTGNASIDTSSDQNKNWLSIARIS